MSYTDPDPNAGAIHSVRRLVDGPSRRDFIKTAAASLAAAAAPVDPPAKISLAERLARYFRMRPNIWIDGKRLADIAGGYAWRTRVSELRTRHGMNIENRVRRIPKIGQTPKEHVKVSEYRYVPRGQKPAELPLLDPIDGGSANG